MLATLRAVVVLGLALTSAALLADMQPNEKTAERIINARITELGKKTDLLSEKTVKEHFGQDGQPFKLPSGEALPTNLYTLEYALEPLKPGENDQDIRRLNIAIHWRPNPNVKQTQTIRQLKYIKITPESSE